MKKVYLVALIFLLSIVVVNTSASTGEDELQRMLNETLSKSRDAADTVAKSDSAILPPATSREAPSILVIFIIAFLISGILMFTVDYYMYIKPRWSTFGEVEFDEPILINMPGQKNYDLIFELLKKAVGEGKVTNFKRVGIASPVERPSTRVTDIKGVIKELQDAGDDKCLTSIELQKRGNSFRLLIINDDEERPLLVFTVKSK